MRIYTYCPAKWAKQSQRIPRSWKTFARQTSKQTAANKGKQIPGTFPGI